MLGRRGDNEMVNKKLIKIVDIKQKNARSVYLDLQLGKERGSYNVSIVDRNGIFGLELPNALGLKLRSFPPSETRSLVTQVKRQITQKLIHA